MPTASGHTTAIRASRVIGTSILNQDGKEIGTVQDIILDKTKSRIKFAVVSISGALVAVDNFYPIPWSALRYDEAADGYVVPFTKEELVDAPAVKKVDELTKNDGDKYSGAAHEFFNTAHDS